ncbi:MAG: hypothetical protein M1816_004088 [Peltula sp. TS41687]|nr:MAG: hypothetical protein M1816_004088 [Peltula sp. TS41687]
METPTKAPSALFQVYLRLKPPVSSPTSSLYPELPGPEPYIAVEEASSDLDKAQPTHIIVTPPSESKRRAVEKFAFTRVFQEDAGQLDIFHGVEIQSMIEGVLGPDGKAGRDGLLATLGVTGSGKVRAEHVDHIYDFGQLIILQSHTILGSSSQRGLTQITLDILFRSLGGHLLHPDTSLSLLPTLAAADVSEAQLIPAAVFLDGLARDFPMERMTSRAQTPVTVGQLNSLNPESTVRLVYASPVGLSTGFPTRGKDQSTTHPALSQNTRVTRSTTKLRLETLKDGRATPAQYHRHVLRPLSALPQVPDVNDIEVSFDGNADYAILVSMYEVYNDRIYDLLGGSQLLSAAFLNQKDLRRRALLFKSTERSPDRKVVAGLRKVICGNLDEALLVLETGLTERRVAGTGSNSVSSRSHGFICFEVKKRLRRPGSPWTQSTLTIVDLAGSERARNAKTAGATLAEAGKINESLMYLGQCLQMQSDSHERHKAAAVPFRQCKLTELLFSNSFPSHSSTTTTHHPSTNHRNPQRAIMIVTADALGDFNATSQILRYSALVREVTVPRIPSIASTILSGRASKDHLTSGRTTPTGITTDEIVFAAQEIARLSQELEETNIRLAGEQNRRYEAELALKAVQESHEVMEQEIREECWEEMERRIDEEQQRWKTAWAEEAVRNEEHLDKKLDILARSISTHEDRAGPSSSAPVARMGEMEEENRALLHRIAMMERELHNGRSPSKKSKNPKASIAASNDEPKQHESELDHTIAGLKDMALNDNALKPNNNHTNSSKTPGKKQRKLTTRKWDLEPEDAISP